MKKKRREIEAIREMIRCQMEWIGILDRVMRRFDSLARRARGAME